LAFFSNFVGRFRPFFTEGLTFFEKISLATPLHPFIHDASGQHDAPECTHEFLGLM